MKGFTLIEILIALLISTLIALLTFSGLQSLLQINQKLNQTHQRLAGLQTVFWHCQQDFAQYQPAFLIDPQNDPLPSFNLQPNSISLVTAKIPQFNVPYPNSGLLYVSYQVQNQTLYRVSYPIENQAFTRLPIKEPLLHNVKQLSFLALDQHNQWHTSFNVAATESTQNLPKAIDMIVYLNKTQVHRLFPLFNPLIKATPHA